MPAHIFVDTSVWIEFFNRNRHADFIREGLIGNTLYSSGVILAELMQRAASNKELKSLTGFFKGLHVLVPDTDLYERCGLLQYELRKKGTTIPLTDAIIGTICMANGLALATKDKHFKMIPGLHLVDL